MSKNYLFSVDLEDIRDLTQNGFQYRDCVPEMVDTFLAILDQARMKATFFVLGNIARRHPGVIRAIHERGHEIGCHTDSHIFLTDQQPSQFRDDIRRNLEALYHAGVEKVIGFRAPLFSLTPKTTWVYAVLKELGFRYSSSVLPAKSPCFGWEGFGYEPKVFEGIVELPMTVGRVGPLQLPFGGGVYFRALPRLLLFYLFKRAAKRGQTVLGYLHPYDIDCEQEKYRIPGLDDHWFFYFLRFYGRRSVLTKLRALIECGYQITTYENYLRGQGLIPSERKETDTHEIAV